MANRLPQSQPQRQRGCLGPIIVVGVLLVALVAVYGLLIRPAISAMIGDMISQRIAESAAVGQATEQASAALSGAIAALPPGETVVEQSQVDTFIQEHLADVDEIERASVSFGDGYAMADLSAFGVSGTARGSLTATNGRVELVDPQIDGALGLAVSPDELITPLVDQVNAELARQGIYVEDIQIREGQIVIVTR